MLSHHIYSLILEKFDYEPTASQERLLNGFAGFVISREVGDTMVVKGYAGTGKTTLVSAMVKVLFDLGIQTVLLAPTGRAAKVFGSFAGKPAFTIHKMIYRQKTAGMEFGRFELNWNKFRDTLFIVDEASMIANASGENNSFGSGHLLEDLLSFVFQGTNCKLILMGDSAQLPPVGFELSPALDVDFLGQYGLNVSTYFLDDVVRQSLDSNILRNATTLRKKVTEDIDLKSVLFHIDPIMQDMYRLSGVDLINELTSCYDRFGMDDTIVICRSNKRVSQYNKGIRNSILFREEELVKGDLLMVVKNNYFWLGNTEESGFIANGDIVEVVKVRKHEEMYGLRFANVTLRFPDHENKELDAKIILDVLNSDSPALTYEQQLRLFENVQMDYADIGNKRKRLEEIRKNPYYNALQVKYAYAVTCHKAQGGQWKCVFVDQGIIRDDENGADYLRWLYTAITRATQKLYLINFPDRMFV